jgi:hypothetical protein
VLQLRHPETSPNTLRHAGIADSQFATQWRSERDRRAGSLTTSQVTDPSSVNDTETLGIHNNRPKMLPLLDDKTAKQRAEIDPQEMLCVSRISNSALLRMIQHQQANVA